MITSYVANKHPGKQITAFAEVGTLDQQNIREVTGRAIAKGFYLRLKPFPESDTGIVSIWALESDSIIDIVTNQQIEYGRHEQRVREF